MVLIPSGEFEMGDHYGVGDNNAKPVHTVFLDEFYMDVYEVTNQQYCDFLNSALSQGLIEVSNGAVYATGGSVPYYTTYPKCSYSAIERNRLIFTTVSSKANHPIVMVSWYGAAAYCNWRSRQEGHEGCYDPSTWVCDFTSSGYRLPTEAEWEYAARGGYHNPYYRYPWGSNEADSSMLNFNCNNPLGLPTKPYTTPVGYYQTYGYGLCDMAGNVWEWCNDRYDGSYYASSQYKNPTGPVSGILRVIRGGYWSNSESNCTVTSRCINNPSDCDAYIGFRIVLDLNSEH
jgi:formylglycine-generating enzyme required for sulfatase activity